MANIEIDDPFGGIEADVAPTDMSVLGSLPNFLPATALIPICAQYWDLQPH
ncbi:hypothetical protein [Chitinophaga pinensis]|uniref:hypothetical protein n=1 Tax=Chitinophaga pinensis TaxID=79329 RepID=UPI0021BDDA87|nr:hypothetical protein [Chitinophaga pinensis]